MIKLKRSAAPDIFQSTWIKKQREELFEYLDTPKEKRESLRYRFRVTRLYKEIRPVLLEMSQGKCAFCESVLDPTGTVHVESFRPKGGATNLDGELDPDHYAWLAYEWENLYPICPNCNMNKGSRFPVDGARVPLFTFGDELQKEGNLLLDPCHDDPEDHLVFNEEGFVASDTQRGRVTIEVYGLNRYELVKARKADYQRLRESLRLLGGYIERNETPPDDLSVEALSQLSHAYTGMRRQFITRWMQSPRLKYKQTMAELTASLIPDWSPQEQRFYSQREQRQTFEDWGEYKNRIEDYDLADESRTDSYYMSTRLIERIEIENFKCIQDLAIDIPSGLEGDAPWLILLGENGLGKSSILQAIGLALIGEKYRGELPVRASDVLRNEQQSGSVRIFFTGGAKPIELTFRAGDDQFSSDTPEPKFLILAYGATRLLPRFGTAIPEMPDYAKVDNLFNPFIPLNNAASWLLGLDDSNWEIVKPALMELIPLDDEDDIRRNDSVEAIIAGDRVSLENLCDGYQSVLALATDIMAVMIRRWKRMDIAEGIVLIDEIGSHLHPSWKMQIVESMRRVFPRIQFIVATHEPLCLLGSEAGEVHRLMRLPDTRKIHILQTDVPKGISIDQLLTGGWFGLSTTLDSDTRALMEEHSRLLMDKDPDPNQVSRRLEIENILRQRFGGFAETSVEQLAMSAAAEYMFESQKELNVEERKIVRGKILKRLQAKGGGA